jgi:hypothetical protein
MKILKIERMDLDGEKIVVHVEGYDHAQPVFDANISEEELKTKLKEWKKNQDEVDAINKKRADEAKQKIKLEPKVNNNLKSLEGLEF